MAHVGDSLRNPDLVEARERWFARLRDLFSGRRQETAFVLHGIQCYTEDAGPDWERWLDDSLAELSKEWERALDTRVEPVGISDRRWTAAPATERSALVPLSEASTGRPPGARVLVWGAGGPVGVRRRFPSLAPTGGSGDGFRCRDRGGASRFGGGRGVRRGRTAGGRYRRRPIPACSATFSLARAATSGLGRVAGDA